MPRNLTPLHLRCAPLHCPSITQMDNNEYLIVGRSATMAAACEDIPVVEGEHAVIVSGELLAGVPRTWMAMDSAPKDGRPILVWDGLLAMQIVEWDASGKDGYNWSDRGGSFFHVEEFTHWMSLPQPPAEKEPS